MASIVWNLIPRNTQVEEAMRQEMRQKIAQLTRRPLKQVKQTLATVQRRLREELLREEALT